MRVSVGLLDAIIRLLAELEPETSLTAAQVVERLAETGYYRFRGRDRHTAVEQVSECLADGFVFRPTGRGTFALQNAFHLGYSRNSKGGTG